MHIAARLGASLLALATVPFAARVAAGPRPVGEVRVLAPIPSPGYPEGVIVRNSRAYVATQSHPGTAGLGPSTVVAFRTRTGKVARTYTIQGENLSQDHTLTNMAFDSRRRLYVLSSQLGLLRLDLRTGAQEVYAPPIPDLPACAAVPAGTPCSPTATDSAPLANSLAFDAAGNAYVSDSSQATIFRIPPGGPPAIWFQDARLDGIVGVNGLRIGPDGSRLFLAVTFTAQATGAIYSLPLVDAPQAGDLALFHQYALEGPDEIVFGRSGRLYVSLAVANAASVLAPDGSEVARYPGPATNGIPIDSPSGVAFAGRSLLMNNHALFTGDTQHMVVFDIFVNDRGARLPRPRLP
jgi:sugar lactone lactonase YvrE